MHDPFLSALPPPQALTFLQLMCPLLLLLQVDCCSRLQHLLSTVHMLQSAAAREHCVLLQVAMSPLRSTGNVATALLYVALQCTGICCHSSAKFTFELECGSSGVKMYCNLSIPVQCHQYSVICSSSLPWLVATLGPRLQREPLLS